MGPFAEAVGLEPATTREDSPDPHGARGDPEQSIKYKAVPKNQASQSSCPGYPSISSREQDCWNEGE